MLDIFTKSLPSSLSLSEALPTLLVLCAVCFLLGSIPWGVIISKLLFNKDIRNEGSGNIGTTNAFRAIGKGGGVAVFILDFGKGVLASLLAYWVSQSLLLDSYSQLCLSLSFICSVWGHIFSPWLKFKGGKGIAVAIGCLFIVFGPLGALLEIAIFTIFVISTRYVSLGSIVSAMACPLISLYYMWGNWPCWFLCTIAALTIIWAHRSNIKRLLQGNENRIGKNKKA